MQGKFSEDQLPEDDKHKETHRISQKVPTNEYNNS